MTDTLNELEVDNRTGLNHEGPDANRPVARLTAMSIVGDPVENLEGENLGKIEDLMINVTNGKIEYVVLEYGTFLGIGGKLFAIPFHELALNVPKKVFVLNRSKDYLKNAPGFDKNHWPNTNLHSYFNDVNHYYGAGLRYF